MTLLFGSDTMVLLHSCGMWQYWPFRITTVACMASWVYRRLLMYSVSTPGPPMVSDWWWRPRVSSMLIIWWTTTTFAWWSRSWAPYIITIVALVMARWGFQFCMCPWRWRYWIRPLQRKINRNWRKRKDREML